MAATLEELLGHRSKEVHQWSCPSCAYTVTQSKPFVLERCPSCQDGKGAVWSGGGTMRVTL